MTALFSLSGIVWVFPSMIKETLLSWPLWEENEEGMEICSFMNFVDNLEGKKLKSV